MSSLDRWLRSRSFGAGVALAVIACCGLAGCATSGARTEAGAARHDDVWESVFLPSDTAEALGYAEAQEAPGYDRNDGRLSLAYAEPLTASGDWPQPERPSVEWTRYVSLPRSPSTVLFFLPERPRPRTWPWWW